MKYEFPISGCIIVEADDDEAAYKELVPWIFDKGNNFNLPDVFDNPGRPLDIVMQVDHHHVVHCPEEYYSRIMRKFLEYQKKKLTKFLPKKKCDVVLAAIDAEG